MFNYLLSIFILFGIQVFEVYRHKNIVCPTVIYPVMWILSIGGLIASSDNIWPVRNVTLIIIVAGYLLFTIGFELICGISIKFPKDYSKSELPCTSLGLNIITLISIGICLLFTLVLWRYIDFGDLLGSWVNVRYKILTKEIEMPYILTVARYFVRCTLWMLGFFLAKSYILTDSKKISMSSKVKKKKIFVMLRIGLLCTFGVLLSFYDFSRNDILFISLPMLFMFLFTDRENNKRNLGILVSAFLLFIVFYLWFMNYRGPDSMLENYSLSHRMRSLLNYLSGAIKALDEDIRLGNIKLITTNGGNGAFTLSAFIGIFERFFGGNNKLDVMENMIQIGNSEYTNVYTFYHWTAKDFGIIYSLGWQLVFGIAYGKLYYSSLKGSELSFYIYCVLVYPLIMMFFQDQYFSIGQSWIILAGFNFVIIITLHLSNKLNAGKK